MPPSGAQSGLPPAQYNKLHEFRARRLLWEGRAGDDTEAPKNALGVFGRLEITATALFSIFHKEVVSVSLSLESRVALIVA